MCDAGPARRQCSSGPPAFRTGVRWWIAVSDSCLTLTVSFVGAEPEFGSLVVGSVEAVPAGIEDPREQAAAGDVLIRPPPSPLPAGCG
jgi:hypothetical protein